MLVISLPLPHRVSFFSGKRTSYTTASPATAHRVCFPRGRDQQPYTPSDDTGLILLMGSGPVKLTLLQAKVFILFKKKGLAALHLY
jgi:hypothetical protein